MIRLLPTTDSQTIAVIPRDFPTASSSFDEISLVITEDGTNITETILDIEAYVPDDFSNFVYMDIEFSILKEESSYYLEFKNSGRLWYRDKAYVTSQTDDEVVHTINKDKYETFVGSGESQYIVL